MALNCVDTAFFGQVCDSCNGGAIYQILAGCLDILTILIGACAVIGIIIAGIMYINSAGDVARQTKAKRRIYEVIIGLCCYGVLFAFANFLIPGGVIRSSSDNTALSCPAEKPKATEQISLSLRTEPEVQEQPNAQAQPSTETPAREDGTEDNSDQSSPSSEADHIDQSTIDLGGEKAAYFLSDPVVACPKNTKHGSAGTTVDYTSGELAGWSAINAPIDIVKYSEYLQANHISMDGQTCLTNGSCKRGYYYDDDGNCEKFAPVLAGNLNSNTCVSNDAFASHMGRTDKNMFSSSLWVENNRERGSGNFSDVPKRVDKLYFDPRLNFDSAGNTTSVYSGKVSSASSVCEISKMILAELIDYGRPVVVRIRGGTGHWAVAVGVKTTVKNEYLEHRGNCGGVPKLSGAELLILNTDSKIYHDQAKYYSGLNNDGGSYRIMTSCGRSYCGN